MRVLLPVIGTLGDLFPFLALAREFTRRGHEVTICTYPMYEGRIRELSLDFLPTHPYITREYLNAGLLSMASDHKPRMFEDSRRFFSEMILKDALQRYEEIREAARGADFAVCHHFDYPAQEAVIREKVPWACTALSTFHVPTKRRAPHFEKLVNYGPLLNTLQWKTAGILENLIFLRPVRDFLAAVRSERPRIRSFPESPHINFIAVSPHVETLPDDYPPSYCRTGIWEFDQGNAGYVPPAELEAFLAEREKPVVVTLGSMGGRGEGMAEVFVEAARRFGRPVILQKGWCDLGFREKQEDVLSVNFIPHDFLFRRAYLVIHHGGAGTSYAACRAGVPSIVIAHASDQYFIGQMLGKRNVAPRPIRRLELSVRTLSDRMARLVRGDMFRSARLFQGSMTEERGAEKAVRAAENLLAGGPNPS